MFSVLRTRRDLCGYIAHARPSSGQLEVFTGNDLTRRQFRRREKAVRTVACDLLHAELPGAIPLGNRSWREAPTRSVGDCRRDLKSLAPPDIPHLPVRQDEQQAYSRDPQRCESVSHI